MIKDKKYRIICFNSSYVILPADNEKYTEDLKTLDDLFYIARMSKAFEEGYFSSSTTGVTNRNYNKWINLRFY